MSETIFADGILNGHVAFVTGGGTGITGGVARAFAEAGASVALVSRKMDHLQPAADAINQNGGKAIPVAADVRQPEAVENAVAQTIEAVWQDRYRRERRCGEFSLRGRRVVAKWFWHGGRYRFERNVQRLSRGFCATQGASRADSEHQCDASLSRHADAASRFGGEGRGGCVDAKSRGGVGTLWNSRERDRAWSN